MNSDRQEQKAGSNSSQIQVSGDFVYMQGVTEERALEIAEQAAQNAISEYSAESQETAMGRIEKFDASLVKDLADEGLLGALADPAVQVTLRKAQLGAASTERDSDYDLLAELITDRASRPEDRRVRAAINRAVEVVDQVEDEALVGLTVAQAALQWRPLAGSIDPGLKTMERLLGQLMDGFQLPQGNEWLENLDILDAVRMHAGQKFRKFDEYWSAQTPGYVSVGVEAGSDAERQAMEEMSDAFFPLPVVDHELKPGYRRLSLPHAGAIEQMPIPGLDVAGNAVEDLIRVARDSFHVDTVDSELIPAYMEKVKSHECHARLAEWWDSFPEHFTITAVGKVLARANAKRLDRLGMLPPLE